MERVLFHCSEDGGKRGDLSILFGFGCLTFVGAGLKGKGMGMYTTKSSMRLIISEMFSDTGARRRLMCSQKHCMISRWKGQRCRF